MVGMAIEIPTNPNPELVPLSWPLGGKVPEPWYEGQENTPFSQIITFEQEGLPFIEPRRGLSCSTMRAKLRPITVETGFWRMTAPLTDADGGRYRLRRCSRLR